MASQYERNELARQARETGLCMKCGKPIEDREALTKDGKAFASCKDCRPSKQPRVNIRDTEFPRVRKMYDDENIYSRFDEPDAQRYFAKVGLLLRQRPVTIREINETYPPPFGVTAYDAIEKTDSVMTDNKYISRYWVEDRRREQQRKFNGAIEPPARKQPDTDSQFRERRI